MKENEFVYEGVAVEDGTYTLGQLSKPRHGRVCIPGKDELYNDMLVDMDEYTFNKLFDYVKNHDASIQDFSAVVVDNKIIDVY